MLGRGKVRSSRGVVAAAHSGIATVDARIYGAFVPFSRSSIGHTECATVFTFRRICNRPKTGDVVTLPVTYTCVASFRLPLSSTSVLRYYRILRRYIDVVRCCILIVHLPSCSLFQKPSNPLPPHILCSNQTPVFVQQSRDRILFQVPRTLYSTFLHLFTYAILSPP